MRNVLVSAILAVILSGCGGQDGEDFIVNIDRPAAEVMAAFAQVDISEAKRIFPDIDVLTRKAAPDELVYDFPNSGLSYVSDDEAVVHLRFEPSADGAKTTVHARVSVPAIKVDLDGEHMVYSEQKVETKLEKAIRSSGRKLEHGQTGASAINDFSDAISGIAIGSNEKLAERLADGRDGPALPTRFGAPTMPVGGTRSVSYGSGDSGRPQKFGEVRTDANGFRFGDPTNKMK